MKVKKQFQFLFLLVFINTFISCQSDNKKPFVKKIKTETFENSIHCPKYILDNKENNLNISILLDLSDRIEEPKTQKKDSAYLLSLSKSFIQHVKTKQLILLEDRIQLFFNPEPSSEKINEIAKNLKIVFTKQTNKEQIKKTLSLYTENPSKLYSLAKFDAENAGGYPGSDIWRFFKDNVKDYSINECHRNILVILTDGYMYYNKTVMKEKNRTSYLTPKSLNHLKLNKSNWEDEMERRNIGFIPANQDLNDLEVLVIGIKSLNNENPYSKDIIKNYWEKWFNEMGIKKHKIKFDDIPSNIEKVIFDFINR